MKFTIAMPRHLGKIFRRFPIAPNAKKFALATGIAFGALACACSVLPQSSRNDLLIAASEKGQVAEMLRLIHAGADINGHNAEGWTPYLAASSNGRFDAMRLLRSLGARTEAPDPDPISMDRRDLLKD